MSTHTVHAHGCLALLAHYEAPGPLPFRLSSNATFACEVSATQLLRLRLFLPQRGGCPLEQRPRPPGTSGWVA